MVKQEKIQVTSSTDQVPKSAFAGLGMKKAVSDLVSQIRDVYLADDTPWIIGYSGGKDSTAVLQLVWMALESLDPAERNKKVYVVTNDTLVENPIVAQWVNRSHDQMRKRAVVLALPVEPHRLTPKVSETFWVNLIGRGYPAPNRRFRWCTERMKIHPTTRFIREVVDAAGQAIIVLGVRKAESASRAARIAKYDAKSIRENLSPHNDLPAALVYKPVVEWSNDDVWMFLMQYPNPWDFDNKDLLTMYKAATADEECPLVMDTTTPSCGSSRFGCWTCTLVAKDKSMTAMIQNDAEREWMLPLLEIRDDLVSAGRETRDFRRLNGKVSLFNGENVPGPYTQKSRTEWLTRVLEAQKWVRKNGPEEVADIDLITPDELHEIRRIWVEDKHEHEDLLPGIYEKAIGEPFLESRFNDNFPFGQEALETLWQESSSPLQYELLRELLSVEHKYRTQVRRRGVMDAISSAFDRSGYESEEEAITHIKALTRGRDAAAEGARSNFIELVDEVNAGVVANEMT
jgi:DNA sulfur modification protein DndC